MISVILPTYNRAHLLPQVIGSLARQSFRDFEVIVVDNNSNDDTRQVVEALAAEHQGTDILYIFEPRQGLVFARHAGVKAARHEILAFLDDDGIVCSDWLDRFLDVYRAHPEVAAVAGKIVIRWDSEPPGWVVRYEPLLGKLDYGDEAITGKELVFNGGNFSIRKPVLLECGGFNPDQIADWLIGDGETGLCKKLLGMGLVIGWAPGSLMEHCQTVSLNATVRDIRRRFVNNGIAVPYRIYCINNEGALRLLVNLLASADKLLRHSVFYLRGCCIRSTDERLMHYFLLCYYGSQFPYTLKLLMNKNFRQLVSDNGLV